MMSILTDCPTREKRGWLEQDHLNGPALRYNFGLAPLMAKTVQDMGDSQRANGLVPSTAPDYMRHPDNNKFCNPPEWGSACILVPWQQYQFDGDVDLLRNSYGTMTHYLAYLNSMAKDNLLNFGLGDWFSHEKTPVPLTGTAIYYHDVKILSQIATLLGKPDDAAQDDKLAQNILASFNQTFFKAATNTYATGSEGSNATALAFDLVAPSARAAVLDNLVQSFTAHQTTVGEVCLKYLLDVLAAGHSDLIYSTYNTDTSGYGLQVKLGKTSLTEGWDGGASQDHFMFGQLNEWLYSGLAGIQSDPQVPGFHKIIIKPAVVGDLAEVKARYDSAAGEIVSEWQRNGSTLRLYVVIPPNSTAMIEVPAAGADSVKEGGLPAGQAPGLKFVQMNASAAEFEAGSGDYHFESKLP
jgi:hypothetical protein